MSSIRLLEGLLTASNDLTNQLEFLTEQVLSKHNQREAVIGRQGWQALTINPLTAIRNEYKLIEIIQYEDRTPLQNYTP